MHRILSALNAANSSTFGFNFDDDALSLCIIDPLSISSDLEDFELYDFGEMHDFDELYDFDELHETAGINGGGLFFIYTSIAF